MRRRIADSFTHNNAQGGRFLPASGKIAGWSGIFPSTGRKPPPSVESYTPHGRNSVTLHERKLLMNARKLIALLLTLLLAAVLLPAAAEEDAAAPTAPITIEAYKAAYEAVVAANAPECSITWTESVQDGQTVSCATINNSFVSLLLLHDGGMAAEAAVLINASLTLDNMQSFLSMAGYSIAARLVNDGTEVTAATDSAMSELMMLFTSMASDAAPLQEVCGFPVGPSISALSENVWQFYFVLPISTTLAAE